MDRNYEPRRFPKRRGFFMRRVLFSARRERPSPLNALVAADSKRRREGWIKLAVLKGNLLRSGIFCFYSVAEPDMYVDQVTTLGAAT